MGQIDDLNSSDAIPNILRRLRALEFASNQNNMAVGRGGIRVHSGGGITIENGGLSVTGSAAVSGLLTVTGSVRLTGQTDIWGPLIVTGETDLDGLTTINGDTSITGQLTVAGPTEVTGTLKVTGVTDLDGDTTVAGDFTVEGPMKTTGTLDVEGITTLKNDLNVTTGANIKAGGVTIDPDYLDGSLRFDNGAYLAATPNGAQFKQTGTSGGGVSVSESQADIFGGGKGMIFNTNGVFFVGALPETTNKPNLYVDGAGKVYKSTASF
ncbi:hypothetical protein ACIPY3_02665 [Paenarthrobacter sp. NPDC089714]|uniref:hypothetical protein n=1 Tax=Paenarthrobacter sp. NPDC089714 TaxID=3364377 RepID=UPI003806817C